MRVGADYDVWKLFPENVQHLLHAKQLAARLRNDAEIALRKEKDRFKSEPVDR
jgi:hypothetical protein